MVADDDSSSNVSGQKISSIEQRIVQLGYVLPPPSKAAANYIPVQQVGDLLFLSGHLPFHSDGTTLMTGRIGSLSANNNNNNNNNEDVLLSVEYGYEAAKLCGLNLLATLHHYLNGNLDRIEQIVKIFGIVQSTDNFHEQHKVMNGCSDLLVEIFGIPIGVHARSAIGTNSLPLNISVEIEMIIKIKN